MADDKKYDNIDLDSILSEINSTISKEVSKTSSVKTKKPKATETAKREAPKKKPKPPQKPATPKPKINSAFADSAKIIEHAVEDEDEDLYSGHAVRFIAVTASEVVEEAPPILILPPEAPLPEKKQEPQVVETQEADTSGSEPAIISLGNIPSLQTATPTVEPTAPPEDITRESNRHIQKIRKKKQRPRMTRRQKTTAIIGMIMTVLVIIGAVSVVIAATKATYNTVGQTALKKELALQIFPFTIIDIPQFDDVKKLDNMSIISAAIWAFIIDDNDKSIYNQDNLGTMYVPDVDIELYIRRLFGNEIAIKHQSVEGSSVMMYYDETARTYAVESTPKMLPYRPRIDKIAKKDDIYTLKVSYILPDAMWNFDSVESKGVVDKTMEYVLKKNKESYQVISVKLLSIAGYTSSLSATPSDSTIPQEDDVLAPINEEMSSAVTIPLNSQIVSKTTSSDETSKADSKTSSTSSTTSDKETDETE